MYANTFLLVFAVAFLGCVLVTPLVTRVASWVGAIDRPDHFRRIHRGAIPRLGGLSLAVGLAAAVLPAVLGGRVPDWPGLAEWWLRQWPVAVAVLLVLALGAIDDVRGVSPRAKLLGQAAAILVLIGGGVRITEFRVLGVQIVLSHAWVVPVLGREVVIDLPSTLVTLAWFLACMNIWNLIDGMDGLASGVGLLVSGTMMLVAIKHVNNPASAALAAALAGSLAGFLLYNWHPACIFLGDSGSLLIGLLIGVIGVQSSMKGTAAVSILFPILAMGLPISDTAMAIFRRWVRDLPLSTADRRHVHHLLIGLGLSPRQAAIFLYSLTGFMCGVVLIGVTLNNPTHGEVMALLVGASGCLGFLLILTSRRDELRTLRADFQARMERKRCERAAAEVTWEAIQKIELCGHPEAIWGEMKRAAARVGCAAIAARGLWKGQELLEKATEEEPGEPAASGSVASFRLQSGDDLRLVVTCHLAAESDLPADIAFRSLQRLALAAAQRLDRVMSEQDLSAAQEADAVPQLAGREADLAPGHAGPPRRPRRRLGQE